MRSHLPVGGLVSWATRVQFRKCLPNAFILRHFLPFSFSSFRVSGLMLKPLIWWRFIFMYGERWGQVCSSTFGCSVYPAPFVRSWLFANKSSWHLCTTLGVVCVWVYIQIFCSIPLVHVSVLCDISMQFLLRWLCSII